MRRAICPSCGAATYTLSAAGETTKLCARCRGAQASDGGASNHSVRLSHPPSHGASHPTPLTTLNCPRCGAVTYHSRGGRQVCSECGHKLGLVDKLLRLWRDRSAPTGRPHPAPTPADREPTRAKKECIACRRQVEGLAPACPYCGGESFFYVGSREGALEMLDSLEKALEAAQHVTAGGSLFREGRYSEAEAELKRAIEINPKNANAYGNMGALLLRQGKPKAAIPWFEKALELNPHLEGAPDALAEARKAAAENPAVKEEPIKEQVVCLKCHQTYLWFESENRLRSAWLLSAVEVKRYQAGLCPRCEGKLVYWSDRSRAVR